MMVSDPQQRLTVVDLQRDDYVIEIMHIIDSSQVKYPASRDTKWDHHGIFSLCQFPLHPFFDSFRKE